MAGKTDKAGEMVVMDRGEMFTDLRQLERKLKKALRKTNDESKEFINSGITDIAGKDYVDESEFNCLFLLIHYTLYICLEIPELFLVEIIDKMFEDQKCDRGGGYVSNETDDEYEKEVGEREEEKKKKKDRIVALVAPNIKTPPVQEPVEEVEPEAERDPEPDSDSSGSNSPLLIDYVRYLSRSTLIVMAQHYLRGDEDDSDTPPPLQ